MQGRVVPGRQTLLDGNQGTHVVDKRLQLGASPFPFPRSGEAIVRRRAGETNVEPTSPRNLHHSISLKGTPSDASPFLPHWQAVNLRPTSPAPRQPIEWDAGVSAGRS